MKTLRHQYIEALVKLGESQIDAGSITIVLEPFVTVPVAKHILLTLFPEKETK